MLVSVTRHLNYDNEGYEDRYIYDYLKETDAWQEVTQSELELLECFCRSSFEQNKYYKLIVFENEKIPMTIEAAIEIAKGKEKKRLAKEKRDKEAAQKRAVTIKTNALAKKKKALEKLKAELKDLT